MASDRVHSPEVLLVVGYFDPFSGYQETALADGLSKVASTEVLTSDRVSPAFSDEHLDRLGVPRRYASGTTMMGVLTITRLPSRELRSMVWSSDARHHISRGDYKLIVQMMPGQLLPAAGSLVA